MSGQAELAQRFARLTEISGIMTAMKSLSLVETKKLARFIGHQRRMLDPVMQRGKQKDLFLARSVWLDCIDIRQDARQLGLQAAQTETALQRTTTLANQPVSSAISVVTRP